MTRSRPAAAADGRSGSRGLRRLLWLLGSLLGIFVLIGTGTGTAFGQMFAPQLAAEEEAAPAPDPEPVCFPSTDPDAPDVCLEPGGTVSGPSGDQSWAYLTGYTWEDNSPPNSGAISDPRDESVQGPGGPGEGGEGTAGGTGTFADPITVAAGFSGSSSFPPGSMFYVPYVQAYFVVEDLCGACSLRSGDYEYSIDLWVGSDPSGNCASAVTGRHTAIADPDDRYVVVARPNGLAADCRTFDDMPLRLAADEQPVPAPGTAAPAAPAEDEPDPGRAPECEGPGISALWNWGQFADGWACEARSFAYTWLLMLQEVIGETTAFHGENTGFLAVYGTNAIVTLFGLVCAFAFHTAIASRMTGLSMARAAGTQIGDLLLAAVILLNLPRVLTFTEMYVVQPLIRDIVGAQAEAFTAFMVRVTASMGALGGLGGLIGSLIFAVITGVLAIGIWFILEFRTGAMYVAAVFIIYTLIGTQGRQRWHAIETPFKVLFALLVFPLVLAMSVWLGLAVGAYPSESQNEAVAVVQMIVILVLALGSFGFVMLLLGRGGQQLAAAGAAGGMAGGVAGATRQVGGGARRLGAGARRAGGGVLRGASSVRDRVLGRRGSSGGAPGSGGGGRGGGGSGPGRGRWSGRWGRSGASRSAEAGRGGGRGGPGGRTGRSEQGGRTGGGAGRSGSGSGAGGRTGGSPSGLPAARQPRSQGRGQGGSSSGRTGGPPRPRRVAGRDRGREQS